MRNKRRIPFKEKTKIAVIVDGHTEYWYLKMVQRNEKSSRVDIKPEIPQRKKLSDQHKKVLELLQIYDKVIWIIDLDVVLKESKLPDFLGYKKSLEKKYNNIIIIINHPCLEYWILLHFSSTSPQFTNCGEVEKLLRNKFPEYSKTEKFYTKQHNYIYLRLEEKLPLAIANAKKLGEFDIETPYKGISEMFKLFEELR